MGRKFDDDYEIPERAKRAWREGKGKSRKRDRKILGEDDRIIFLKLIAQMAGYSVFERKLGLDRSEVDYYKELYDVESSDEARRQMRKLERESLAAKESSIITEEQAARDAERLANERLRELETKQAMKSQIPKIVDVNKIKTEDAKRQRLFLEQQSQVKVPENEWYLPLNGSRVDRDSQVDKFKRDIIYRGLNFCSRKYNATKAQIRYEAERLKLDIDWDMIRR